MKAASGGDRLRRLVDRIGRSPAETEDERVRRAIWVITLAVATPIALLGRGLERFALASQLACVGFSLAGGRSRSSSPSTSTTAGPGAGSEATL